jgi:hypothetical protein
MKEGCNNDRNIVTVRKGFLLAIYGYGCIVFILVYLNSYPVLVDLPTHEAAKSHRDGGRISIYEKKATDSVV